MKKNRINNLRLELKLLKHQIESVQTIIEDIEIELNEAEQDNSEHIFRELYEQRANADVKLP